MQCWFLVQKQLLLEEIEARVIFLLRQRNGEISLEQLYPMLPSPALRLSPCKFHFDLSPSHVYLTDAADKWSVLPSLSAVPSVLSWVAPDHLLAFLSVFLWVAVQFFTLVQLQNINANLLFDETLAVKKFFGLLQRKSYLFSFRFFFFLFLSFSSSCFCTLLSFPYLMEFVLSLLTSFLFWPSPCTRKEMHMAVS